LADSVIDEGRKNNSTRTNQTTEPVTRIESNPR